MKNTRYGLKIQEYKTWYTGSADLIQDFYKTESHKLISKKGSNASRGWFWSITPNNPTEDIIKIHTGLPRLISKKMADMVLVNGYSFTIENDTDNNHKYRLEEILRENNFKSKLAYLIETNSWSGGTGLKITLDPIFDEPLIEVVSPENYEPVIYKNRIIADKFKVKYVVDDIEYELHETYGVDREKGSYIKYKLYKLEDNELKEVMINSLEETKDLKDTYIKGLNQKLSIYIPNRLPNSDFKSPVLGESDYSGSEGLFNSLDEIYSTYIQEFRDSKLNRYFPSNYLMLDPATGEYQKENAMKTNHILYSTGISEDIQGKIIYEQGDLRTEKHEEAYKSTLMSVCNSAGLSPLTLGITGLESIISSAESQQEREKVSIRTREMKTELLESSLEKLLPLLLNADDILHGRNISKEYKINFRFHDYVIKSKADKIAEVQMGLQSGVYDLEEAIKYVHDEKSYSDQMKILIMSKIEQGLTNFTAKEAEIYEKLMTGDKIEEEVQT